MILIHARDIHSARGTANRLRLYKEQWRYVMYSSDLRGVDPEVPFFITNDAYLNRDHIDIMEEARFKGLSFWRQA